MRTILFVVNNIPGGGVEQVLCDVCSILQEKYCLKVLSIYESDSVYEKQLREYASLNVLLKLNTAYVFHRFKCRLFDNIIGMTFLFKRFVKHLKPDIIVSFADGLSLDLVARTSSFRLAWVHTDYLNEIKDKKKLESVSRKYKVYDKVVFACDALRKKFVKALSLKNDVVISNTVDIDRLNFLSFNGKSEIADRSDDKVHFLGVGRLSKEKGFDRLISSFGKLNASLRECCHLTIIGSGEERGRLESLISQHRLWDTVSLVGFLENPYPSMRDCDVLLVPSRFEGFGLVVAEALALGKTVVSTSTVGPSEILDNGKFGILVNNSDDAFDDIITKIIIDKSILVRYASSAVKRACCYSRIGLRDNLQMLFS